MLKLSKLTDYAAIILICLNQHKTVVSSTVLATETRIPEPTVAKILKLLTRSSLTKSSRGPGSGYYILDELHEITMARLINSIEGTIDLVDCDKATCRIISEECLLYGKWEVLNERIRQVFETLTLADLKLKKQNTTDLKK